MKTTVVIFLMALMSFGACKKSTNTVDAIVVRDCTGVYLQMNGEDFFVCNYKKLSKYEDGEKVKAAFSTISSCQSDQVVCLMLHPSAGTIDVSYIEKR
jgi:hypothetical protein